MIYTLARFLGGLSFLGGVAATTVAATTTKTPPVLLVGAMTPEDANAWVPVIANAIPAIGGALLVLCSKWWEARRKAKADDDQSVVDSLRKERDAAIAERDELRAKLAEATKTNPEPKDVQEVR